MPIVHRFPVQALVDDIRAKRKDKQAFMEARQPLSARTYGMSQTTSLVPTNDSLQDLGDDEDEDEYDGSDMEQDDTETQAKPEGASAENPALPAKVSTEAPALPATAETPALPATTETPALPAKVSTEAISTPEPKHKPTPSPSESFRRSDTGTSADSATWYTIIVSFGSDLDFYSRVDLSLMGNTWAGYASLLRLARFPPRPSCRSRRLLLPASKDPPWLCRCV